MVTVYTDGSCSVKTGQGGWGYVLVENNKVIKEDCGRGYETTNNRMELTAIIEAMKEIYNHYDEIPNYTIYTDSAYIANCFKEKWYVRWKLNGWRTANRVAVKNKELWEELLSYYLSPMHGEKCTIEYVKGHDGNLWNERADTLATSWRGM